MFQVVDWGLPQGAAPVSNAVRAGTVLYTVQIPRDPVTGAVQADGDIRDQARLVLSNLATVLKTAGGTLKDVAQVQVFLTEASDADGLNEVWPAFFSAPFPNRATVVVKELLVPGMRIEIVVQAHLDAAA